MHGCPSSKRTTEMTDAEVDEIDLDYPGDRNRDGFRGL
jgi:hypothetical protein